MAFLPAQLRVALRVLMPAVTLAGWLISARVERLQKYQGLVSGFFAVSLGLLLTFFVGDLPLKWLDLTTTTIKGVAVAKFSESLPIMLTILIFHFALGGKAEGLFLKGGRLKFGLISSAVGVLILLSIVSSRCWD